jgi:dolichol-phosphate mannosyltransferase
MHEKVVHIIPTYNEKDNIVRMIKTLQRISSQDRKHKHNILIVDDNSPDGTGDLVKKQMKLDKSISLLSGPKRGLGIAMIRGIKHAISNLKADVVIPNEADFGFDPKHIPYMLKKIDEGFDVVVASRHVGEGKTEGWTSNRKINHWVANYLFATWVAGVHEVYDHNGAYRAIRVRGVLDKINLDTLHTRGFGFFNYFLFKLTQVTHKFHEFPTVYKFRTAGESKISFNPKYFHTFAQDVIEYIFLSLKIRLEKTGLIR